jgi:hypothetical protein
LHNLESKLQVPWPENLSFSFSLMPKTKYSIKQHYSCGNILSLKPYYFWIMNAVNHMMSWFVMWRMSSGKSYSLICPLPKIRCKKRWSLQRLSNVDRLNTSSLLKGCPCRKALVPVPLAGPFRERNRKLQGFELTLLLRNMNSSHASTFRPRLV